MELQASTWSPWDARDSIISSGKGSPNFLPNTDKILLSTPRKKGFKHWMEQKGAAFPACQGGGHGWGGSD